MHFSVGIDIGGTCIEVEAQGERIALDVGLPLDAPNEYSPDSLLPRVPGFREPDESLRAVVISHPHQDHYELARHLRPEIPVYIGSQANSVLQAASTSFPTATISPNPAF